MIIRKIFIIVFFIFFTIGFYGAVSDQFGSDSFPRIDGLEFDGKAEVYYPDSLFEYIDGAADQFLEYDFKVLFSRNYKGPDGKAITIDVYKHKNLTNAFGIYSQEKPDIGNFIDVGSQGYYEEGILNFFKGPYYVKISSFDLGKNEKTKLIETAKNISGKFGGSGTFPDEIKLFPVKNRVLNSEKYVSRNFLGYHFLNSAFISTYMIGGKEKKAFIISAGNKKNAQKIINEYRKYMDRKNVGVENIKSRYIFPDPNYSSEGKICMSVSGRYISGVFYMEKKDLDLLNKIEKNILKNVLK